VGTNACEVPEAPPCDKGGVRIIFPRIDFNSNKKRHPKMGEEQSLDTHRRQKLRACKIRWAMVGEKDYIEGLCILNKSNGKAIGCKMKLQIYAFGISQKAKAIGCKMKSQMYD
jgi:hypothetical protein